jgi:hypothetical protein
MSSPVYHNIRYYGDQIANLASELGVEEAALHAVAAIECGEIRHPDEGWAVMRFEVHVCQDRCPADKRAELDQWIKLDTKNGEYKRWDSRAHFYKSDKDDDWQLIHTGSQGDEYGASAVAAKVVGNVALESASYGVGQLMGFHAGLLGYKSVRRMVGSATGGGVPKQIQQWGAYIREDAEGKMHAALKQDPPDFYTFAYYYNGPGRPQDYAGWMQTQYEIATEALEAGVPPDYDLSTWANRQHALVELGYDPGPIDGAFGPKTKAALKQFQSDHGLTPDGVWGPKTETAMKDALAAL